MDDTTINDTSDKIVVVGSENFTFGYEIAGVESFRGDQFHEAISKQYNAGIVILDPQVYEKLSQKDKITIDTLTKPLVVIMSQDDTKGSNLKELIIRALGVDLLKDK